MRYRTMRRLLPRLGAAYLALAGLALTAPGFEIFPFFCWFLFPVTPNVERRYELMVSQIGGRPVDPPAEYQSLDLVEDPMAMDLWIATQDLGRAVKAGDDARIRGLRQRIELNFIPAPNRYTLQRVTYDPLERWRHGAVRARENVAEYTSATGAASIPWTFAP